MDRPMTALPTQDRQAPSHEGRFAYYLRRALRDRKAVWQALNARRRLHGAARLPLTVRVIGRVCATGRRRMTFGEHVLIVGTIVPVELHAGEEGRISIGDGCFINYGTSIAALDHVSIGSGCQIGQYTIINDNDFHCVEDKQRLPPSRPVVLEDRVWLGARVIVRRGVRIGHDAVIGAGSVVTRDIPPRSVAVGVPARVIRSF